MILLISLLRFASVIKVLKILVIFLLFECRRYAPHRRDKRDKRECKNERKMFFFQSINRQCGKTLLSLYNKKSTIENDIPIKVLVGTTDLTMGYITGIYHHAIENQIFPSSLKKADVVPSHKQFEKTDKANYRPVSLLLSISKDYERNMITQIYRRTSFTLSIWI